MPRPQHEAGRRETLQRCTAEGLLRVPQDHSVQRPAELVGGVAAEMLVGEEEDGGASVRVGTPSLALRARTRASGPLPVIRARSASEGLRLRAAEGPFEDHFRVRACAARPAMPPDERLDRGGRVHVRDRHDLAAVLFENRPCILKLVDVRHVRHRAAGAEVGQDDLLPLAREDVGGLGHEVHAAENNVVGLLLLGGDLREPEAVAGEIGEVDDLVALVVVAEEDDARSEPGLRGGDARGEVGVGGFGVLRR